MTFSRLAALFGVAILVLVVNIVVSILYMVVYAHLINPGHEKQFYQKPPTHHPARNINGIPAMILLYGAATLMCSW